MNSKKTPSLNALRAFETAARHGSFVRAADELCVTPASISHLIKGLEAYLEIELFERVGRRVIVSQQAQKILPDLQQGFALIEQALNRLADDAHILTVSAHPIFSAKWLLPRIHQFNTLYPDIDVRIDTNHNLTDFRQGGIDVAICFGDGHCPGMVCRPLMNPYQEEIFPVCSPKLLQGKHPLSRVEALRHHTLLHDDNNSRHSLVPNWARWLERAKVKGVDARRGLRFNDPMLTLEAALNGQGVALCCAYVTADDLSAGRLVRPFVIPYTTNASYHLVYPENKASLKIERFHQWLLDACKVTT